MTAAERNSSPPEPALAASCCGCGGTVPIVLSAPQIQCPFCGSADSLPDAVTERIRTLGARLKSIRAREQQLTGRQARLGRTHSFHFLVIIVVVWLGMGAWVVASFGTRTRADGETISVLSYLAQPLAPAEEFDPVTAGWWILFAFVVGFTLALLVYGLLLVNLRRVVRHALPIAPFRDGRPPRCRCCGADLPGTGLVRRCAFCGADHVVSGERYQQIGRNLEAALDRLEEGLDRTLALRSRRADTAMKFGILLPALLPLLAPLGLSFGATRPGLWGVPGCLLLLALAVLAYAAWLPVPNLRTPVEAGVGDELLVDGVAYRVAALWGSRWPLLKGDEEYLLQILVRQEAAGEIRALVFEHLDADTVRPHVFHVEMGGEPAAENDLEDGALLRISPVPASDREWGSETPLWRTVRFDPETRRVSCYRIWIAPPTEGRLPRHTFTSPQCIGEDRLVLVNPEQG